METPIVYAFIDGQNLAQGVRAAGWELDYRILRLFLKNKFAVSKAFLFIGHMPEQTRLYASLERAGYTLVFKQATAHRSHGTVQVKGNVDADLVLHASAITYSEFDQALVITSDGDFACLFQFLQERGKLFKIIPPSTRYSHLFKPFTKHIIPLTTYQAMLTYKKPARRSVET